MRSFKRVAAFTLIELMVTVSVLAIISALAVPSFNDMIQRNRRAACSNELLGILQWARSEAVRRGLLVRVTAGLNAIAATPKGGGALQQTEACNRSQVTITAGQLPIDFTPNGQTAMGGRFDFSVCDANQVGEMGRLIRVLPTGMVRSSPQPCQ